MKKIKIGVIGYGYWGPNLVRNFSSISEAELVGVSDLRSEMLTKVKNQYPSIEVTTNCQDLFDNPNIDAIAIATPVSTHFKLALAALKSGKHVWVEKPMTTTSEEATKLIEEADQRNLVLMTDHTFVYTGAVKKIHDLVANGSIGEMYYYDSVRVNLGLFQHDVNVIWDLAVHDLSIMDYVLGIEPIAVSAVGIAHFPNQPENIAYLTVFFPNNLIAHINVNWLAPVKVRRTLIGGSQKMILFDDLQPSEKVKIYDKGVKVETNPDNIYQMLVGYRMGDMYAPQLDMTEALKTETLHFVDCIKNKKTPITDGKFGLRLVKILEAATKSMQQQGQPIKLN